MFLPSMCVVISELLCVLFTVARKNLICRCKQRDFFFAAGMGPRLVLISMPFEQHSGAIYLRSKSYLVVNISSDIVTKNCCQLCVLSTMTARVCQLRLPAVYRHARGVVEQTQAATCWPVDSWQLTDLGQCCWNLFWCCEFWSTFIGSGSGTLPNPTPKNYMVIVTMLDNCHCKIMKQHELLLLLDCEKNVDFSIVEK